MDAMTELAKLFKDRNNPSIQGICIGKVLSPPPDLKIAVNGFVFDRSDIVVAKHLINTYSTNNAVIGDHGQHSHELEDILQSGDQIIVIPSINNVTYFVIDKVGGF